MLELPQTAAFSPACEFMGSLIGDGSPAETAKLIFGRCTGMKFHVVPVACTGGIRAACVLGHREVLPLGPTRLTKQEAVRLGALLSKDWSGSSYKLLS